MTLIEQIKQLLDNQVHTQREIAAQAGISAGALSAYLKGTYTGNVENVEVALKNWLSTREKKEKSVCGSTALYRNSDRQESFFSVRYGQDFANHGDRLRRERCG